MQHLPPLFRSRDRLHPPRRPGSVAAVLAVLLITGGYLASVLIAHSQPASATEPVEATAMEPLTAMGLADLVTLRDPGSRKQKFFDYLEHYVAAENQSVASVRAGLVALAEIMQRGFALSPYERQWMLGQAAIYRVDHDVMGDREMARELLLRVDEIPVSLALAQAANESAWGTSRFALQGNNVFGQWCFAPGCGIIPLGRPEDAIHQVQRFDTVAESVESYFLNINTHDSYRYFRQLRANMRQRGSQLDSLALAQGLEPYSQRGTHYVEEVRSIIRQNRLVLRD